ncbi:hypothetical protein ACF0H5_003580 [Mactra antiquata]
MAKSLTKEEISNFKDAFALLDKNNDGFLNYTEVKEILISTGKEGREDYIKQVIRAVDTDDDGMINFPEFLNMIANHFSSNANEEEPQGTELKQMFGIFDRDNDGYITHTEMKRALDELDGDVPHKEIEGMIQEADTDGDGKLTFDEFAAIMKKKNPKQFEDSS